MRVTSKEAKIGLDVDETILLSIDRHVKGLTKHGKRLGWKNLPSYEDVVHAGGTHKAYGHYPGYLDINREMRNSREFNEGLKPIVGALSALTLLQSMLAFYLTTRPESLTRITKEEIDKKGFPDREVIARPKYVPIENTTAWKISVLLEKVKEMRTRLVMIDDSPALNREILRLDDPSVNSILFRGPLTFSDTAMDWKQITKLLKGDHARL